MIRVMFLWLSGHMIAIAVKVHWFFHIAFFIGFLCTFFISDEEINNRRSKKNEKQN